MRRIRRLLGEEPRFTQRAVDFVGRNVLEAEPITPRIARFKPLPVLESRLQQRRRANNIRAHELSRPVNRTIDMRLRGKMKDRIGLKLGKRLIHHLLITDVRDKETQGRRLEIEHVASRKPFRIKPRFLQGFGDPRVRKLVNDKNNRALVLDQMSDKRGSNKSATTRYNAPLILHP